MYVLQTPPYMFDLLIYIEDRRSAIPIASIFTERGVLGKQADLDTYYVSLRDADPFPTSWFLLCIINIMFFVTYMATDVYIYIYV